MSFKTLGLSPTILKTLEKQNFTEATAIQQQAIPELLARKDLLGIAQTGSGKTLSYVLPLLMKVEKSRAYINRHPKALILVPTRELCKQVQEVIQLFADSLDRRIKSMAVYGGVSINPQMINMQNVEILVATPGRLIDLAESKALQFSEVDTFVMDEADKLLNLGFEKEVNQILDWMPSQKQSLLFSATLSIDVENVQKLFLKNPVVIKIEAEAENLDLIKQVAYKVSEERKGPLLRYLIKTQKFEQVLVFASSGVKAEKIASKLVKNGITAKPIHGKLSQGARTMALKRFISKDLPVLVATDLLSRGIDIESLPCVINYELPRSPKDFIHRIGRTGRAGKNGLAISIITEKDMRHFKVILKKMDAWVDLIQADEIDLHGF